MRTWVPWVQICRSSGEAISYFASVGRILHWCKVIACFFASDLCKCFSVHMCNKLASRHVRVGLADPSVVPHCDICENAPAFFYCEIDGSSLCLQCDMIVHVGGKRTHGRYLVLRQRVEFPGDKPGRIDELALQPAELDEMRRNQPHKPRMTESHQNHGVASVPMLEANTDGGGKMDTKMIDLNSNPQRMHGQTSNNQEQGMDGLNGDNHESASVVPVGSFKREFEK